MKTFRRLSRTSGSTRQRIARYGKLHDARLNDRPTLSADLGLEVCRGSR